MIRIDDIRKFFRGHIALSEPLKKYTSFRIGGPADCYLEPADKEDVVKIISYLQQQAISYTIIGRGTNLLVSDEGIRGAVINLEEGLHQISVEGTAVRVQAGLSMARFVDACLQHGLKGVEMLAGIPGTVGGAIIMNAGAYGGEIAQHIIEIEVVRNGKLAVVKKEDAGFSYRHSDFRNDIVLSATFSFPPGDKAEMMRVRREHLIKRNQSQPLNLPNSGSMFKNPRGMFAARLIEEAGLKGTRRGNAQISEKHANFIVNLGEARAVDVLELIELARNSVLKQTGVNLELEVRLVGFPERIARELCA